MGRAFSAIHRYSMNPDPRVLLLTPNIVSEAIHFRNALSTQHTFPPSISQCRVIVSPHASLHCPVLSKPSIKGSSGVKLLGHTMTLTAYADQSVSTEPWLAS